MTRRQALTVIGLLTGQSTASFASSVPKGALRLDLGQWTVIRVIWQGQEYAIDPADVFNALRDN